MNEENLICDECKHETTYLNSVVVDGKRYCNLNECYSKKMDSLRDLRKTKRPSYVLVVA